MKVSTVEQMRNLDRGAIERFNTPDKLLMENAGEALYFVIHSEFGIRGKRFIIFCGIGNNGGDGFVVARKLHSNGGLVTVFLLGDSKKLTGCAKDNFDTISTLPIRIEKVASVEQITSSIAGCDAIVDAIFGTGLVRAVGGMYGEVIELINKSGKTVFGEQCEHARGVHHPGGHAVRPPPARGGPGLRVDQSGQHRLGLDWARRIPPVAADGAAAGGPI